MPITRLRAGLQIKSDSVTSAEIQDYSIGLSDVTPGSLDGSVFSAGSISSDKLDLSQAAGVALVYGSGKLDVYFDNVSIGVLAGKLRTNPAVVTEKGNTFNGANQLVLLDGTGKLPSIDGSQLTGIAGSGSPASGEGGIQFNTSGAFASDAANLFWDVANDRLGIGTSSPTASLHVVGQVRINGGTPGIGRVLVDSDGSGLGVWQPSSSSTTYVDLIEPTGLVNGVNTSFALPSTPVAGSLHLFVNGILMRPGPGNDYAILGANITMDSPPLTGFTILASYRVSA